MEYRRDIDGLRAVAVLPVVLFHLKSSWMPGGFVGVDIFFVISGYLITTVLLDELRRTGRFSIGRFYERRIRRIFPALFTVLLFSIVTALIIFLPADAKALGRSLLWTVFFSSNVLFSREAGYFDQPAATQPLLHTWSLAVEEQFYLLYPIFLFLVLRVGRRRFGAAIGTALVASFALSIWALDAYPVRTFYLAPTRAWELLIGAFLAAGVLPPLTSATAASALGAFGLGLIAVSLVTFSGAMSFPGAWALLPTAGAALVIHAGSTRQALTHRLLGVPVVVVVGLLSYSLYLWHWVAIVFTRYFLIRPIVDSERLLVFASSVAMAWASWRFVERPFRGSGGVGSRRAVFAGATAISVVTVAGAIALIASAGWPDRFTTEALRLAQSAEDKWPERNRCINTMCGVGAPGVAPTFLLWGDSHARAVAPLFDARAREVGTAGVVATWNGCPPLSAGARFDPGYDGCGGFNASILGQITKRNISTVFLHARWALYVEADRYKDEDGPIAALTPALRSSDNVSTFEALFEKTLADLEARHVRVVVIAGTPEVGINVPSALARSVARQPAPTIAPSRTEFWSRQRRTIELMARVAAVHGAQVVYPHELLCGQDSCDVIRDGQPLYTDEHHLGLHGLTYLRPLFDTLLP